MRLGVPLSPSLISETPPAWRMGVPASRIGLLIGLIVSVAVLLALIGLAIVG